MVLAAFAVSVLIESQRPTSFSSFKTSVYNIQKNCHAIRKGANKVSRIFLPDKIHNNILVIYLYIILSIYVEI
jgi:hypothetical protein